MGQSVASLVSIDQRWYSADASNAKPHSRHLWAVAHHHTYSVSALYTLSSENGWCPQTELFHLEFIKAWYEDCPLGRILPAVSGKMTTYGKHTIKQHCVILMTCLKELIIPVQRSRSRLRIGSMLCEDVFSQLRGRYQAWRSFSSWNYLTASIFLRSTITPCKTQFLKSRLS